MTYIKTKTKELADKIDKQWLEYDCIIMYKKEQTTMS
jgi:hypothetical protein